MGNLDVKKKRKLISIVFVDVSKLDEDDRDGIPRDTKFLEIHLYSKLEEGKWKIDDKDFDLIKVKGTPGMRVAKAFAESGLTEKDLKYDY